MLLKNRLADWFRTNNSLKLSPPWDANNIPGIQLVPSVLWSPEVHFRVQKSECVMSSDSASMLQPVIHTSECNARPRDKTSVGQPINCTSCIFWSPLYLNNVTLTRDSTLRNTYLHTNSARGSCVQKCQTVDMSVFVPRADPGMAIQDTIKILLSVVCFNLRVWTTENHRCLCQALRSDGDAGRYKILRTPLSSTAIISENHKSHRDTSIYKEDLFL